MPAAGENTAHVLREGQVVGVRSKGETHPFVIDGGGGDLLFLRVCGCYATYPDGIGATVTVVVGGHSATCEVEVVSTTLIGGPLAGSQVTGIVCRCTDGSLAVADPTHGITFDASAGAVVPVGR